MHCFQCYAGVVRPAVLCIANVSQLLGNFTLFCLIFLLDISSSAPVRFRVLRAILVEIARTTRWKTWITDNGYHADVTNYSGQDESRVSPLVFIKSSTFFFPLLVAVPCRRQSLYGKCIVECRAFDGCSDLLA